MLDTLTREHEAILSAIEEGAAAAVERLLYEHITGFYRRRMEVPDP